MHQSGNWLFVALCNNSRQEESLIKPSLLQAGEKKKYDEITDLMGPIQYKTIMNDSLKALRIELCKKHEKAELDGYCLYL